MPKLKGGLMKVFMLIILSLLISVAACAGNKTKPEPPKPPAPAPNETKPFDAPAWLWEIPSGDYTIGIAYDDGLFGEVLKM